MCVGEENLVELEDGYETYVGNRTDNSFKDYDDSEEAMDSIFKPCEKTGTVPAFVHG